MIVMVTMSYFDATTGDFVLQLVLVMQEMVTLTPNHMTVMQQWVIVMRQLLILFHNKFDKW